jgi:F420-dependent oxidoreductase-like protein
VRVRLFVGGERAVTFDQLVALSAVAEAGGFDGLFRSDHYVATAGAEGSGPPGDAWTTLAGLARETRTLRLGTLVSAATFRPPGPLALIVAQVDTMSGGRVELGLGTGYLEAEHRAWGLAFPPTSARFDRLDEQLAVITGLWATPPGGRFRWRGAHYEIDVEGDLPVPLQRPHPPIIVGGEGRRRTPALAARYADEFNIGLHSLEAAADQYGRVRRACAALDRDPDSIICSGVLVACCGSTPSELRRRAAATGLPLELLRDAGAAGTPEQVVARCRAAEAIGVGTLYLQIRDVDDVDHVALIGRTVLPELA